MNDANIQPRPIKIIVMYTKHAEGSVLVEFGDTKTSVQRRWKSQCPLLKVKIKDGVTAEYGMLPRSTHSRMQREAAKGKQGGRTLEIQRLIALIAGNGRFRSLRRTLDYIGL